MRSRRRLSSRPRTKHNKEGSGRGSKGSAAAAAGSGPALERRGRIATRRRGVHACMRASLWCGRRRKSCRVWEAAEGREESGQARPVLRQDKHVRGTRGDRTRTEVREERQGTRKGRAPGGGHPQHPQHPHMPRRSHAPLASMRASGHALKPPQARGGTGASGQDTRALQQTPCRVRVCVYLCVCVCVCAGGR